MGAKDYKTQCDFSKAILKDDSIQTKFKNLVKTEFDCSQDFVRTLPFENVKKMKRGSWTKNIRTYYNKIEKTNVRNRVGRNKVHSNVAQE